MPFLIIVVVDNVGFVLLLKRSALRSIDVYRSRVGAIGRATATPLLLAISRGLGVSVPSLALALLLPSV